MRFFWLHIAVILILFCYSLDMQGQNTNPSIFNFQTHDFEGNYRKLSGQWEFYYDTLIEPNQLKEIKTKKYIPVPSSWNRVGEFDLLGKATYKCAIVLPINQTGLLLYISTINSSSKVWMNGELRSTSGKLEQDDYLPELTNNYIPIPENNDTIEVVIHVENQTYFNSGLVSSPIIGPTSFIMKEKTLANGIENVFAGSLIAMFIYQILLFFLYNRGKPNLWLALICLVVAIRSMTLNGGSFLLPNLFPEVPFEIWKKLEFGGVYLVVALFPLYVHHLFESSSSKKVISFFIIVALALVSAVIILPQHQYGQLLDVCHISLVLSFIYAITTVLRAWYLRKNPDSKYIFFGVIASFPFILLEILKNTALVNFNIKFGYLVELGLLVFLIFQVYILARHYANSYKTLEEINKELEEEIHMQTKNLTDSNKIKDRLLSIISHDVKSPLNNLKGLLSLHQMSALSPQDFDSLVKQISRNLEETTDMVENVLFWTARQRKGEEIKFESFDIKPLIEDLIKQLKTITENKSLQISHDIEGSAFVYSDKGIINFVFRNLLANAIKFSHNGTVIQIKAIDNQQSYLIQVIDSGVGMSEEQKSNLFKNESVQSTQGTNEEVGTGIGLNLVKEYLEQLSESIEVQSTLNVGSTFEFSISKATQ